MFYKSNHNILFLSSLARVHTGATLSLILSDQRGPKTGMMGCF